MKNYLKYFVLYVLLFSSSKATKMLHDEFLLDSGNLPLSSTSFSKDYFSILDQPIFQHVIFYLPESEQMKIRSVSKYFKNMAEQVFDRYSFPILNEQLIIQNPNIFNKNIPYILAHSYDSPLCTPARSYKIYSLRYFTKMYDEEGKGWSGQNSQTIGEYLKSCKALPLRGSSEKISLSDEQISEKKERWIYSHTSSPNPESSIVTRFSLGLEK